MPTDELKWKRRIGQHILAKNEIAKVDTANLFRYRLPRMACAEHTLVACEVALGEPLPLEFREFLLCADGWPTFKQDWDLFDTAELLGGGLGPRAEELLRYIASEGGPEAQLLGDVLPIAVSASTIDVVVLGKYSRSRSASQPGEELSVPGMPVHRIFPTKSHDILEA